MSESDDVVEEFLVESHEGLEQYDRDLLSLEQDPTNADVLGRIFRTVHSIKGMCGFLGFSKLESVAHAGENLLGVLRDGHAVADAEIADALLATGDAIREMLACIERDGVEGDGDYGALVGRLDELQLTASGAPTVPTAMPANADAAATAREGAAVPSATKATAEPSSPPDSSVSETSIRVDVRLLDHLMNLVGELVLTRNQIMAMAGDDTEPALSDASGRLNLVTTELQESVMKTRMQPIGNVWGRLPRVVRDLAQQCGKRARLEMQGQDTELDKTLLEAIKDPLTHLVRNAVDHGIETPDRRVAAGKDAEGTLSLSAFHEGGYVIVEIADDGAGIDLERIKAKAVERGILSPEDAEQLDDQSAASLIFAPGFSTAAEVTSVSGRGVGMDVVRSNVEQIGGTVDVSSEAGQGTTLRLKIPLTLVIIPALVVRTGGHVFAIPQVGLTELVRLEGTGVDAGIEDVHGSPVYRLRGRLLPIVDLAHQIGEQPKGDGVRTLVVLRTDTQSFGLLVDEVRDTEEIVVKPLAPQVRDISIFAGSTIMGDGRVALILDVAGLAQRAGIASEKRDRSFHDTRGDSVVENADNHTMLVVSLGEGRRAAVPLAEVSRLEEIPVESVERSGHRDVVQYRGSILPLIDVPTAISYPAAPPTQLLRVVVAGSDGAGVGLIVEDIVDIVDQELQLDESAAAAGVRGTAVIDGRVTDVLDVGHIVGQAQAQHAGVSA